MNIWKAYVSRNPFKRFYRKIKYSIQRIKKGYCDLDSWNIDFYLSNVIPGILRQLSKEVHGWPNSCFNNYEDWVSMINRIADLIEAGGNFDSPDEEKLKEGMELLTKYYYDLWD